MRRPAWYEWLVAAAVLVAVVALSLMFLLPGPQVHKILPGYEESFPPVVPSY